MGRLTAKSRHDGLDFCREHAFRGDEECKLVLRFEVILHDAQDAQASENSAKDGTLLRELTSDIACASPSLLSTVYA